ncbi:MAG: hypothetical protein KF897_17725, partial [Opitutaceae bacterium]|nr:hypothetical protein [Opitutaceae bacterium]
GASRTRHVVEARFEAIRLVRAARPDLSLPAIGRLFNRDHTTILHALKRAGTTVRPQPRRADGRYGGEG